MNHYETLREIYLELGGRPGFMENFIEQLKIFRKYPYRTSLHLRGGDEYLINKELFIRYSSKLLWEME